jgi:hypothetical protein
MSETKDNEFERLEMLEYLKNKLRYVASFLIGVPKVSKLTVLETLFYTRRDVVSAGCSWEEEVQALHVSAEYVILAVKVRIKVKDSYFEVVGVGECSKEEKADGTLARVAYTRAMKQVLESLVGATFLLEEKD